MADFCERCARYDVRVPLVPCKWCKEYVCKITGCECRKAWMRRRPVLYDSAAARPRSSKPEPWGTVELVLYTDREWRQKQAAEKAAKKAGKK